MLPVTITMSNMTIQSYRVFTLFCGYIFLAFCLIASISCASWLPEAHKLEITQGNVITPDQVKQLQPGMPKADVRTLLGIPVLQDPFHDQRWDYIFRYLPGNEASQQSRLTLHFENDVLERIDDSDYIDPDTILPPPTIDN